MQWDSGGGISFLTYDATDPAVDTVAELIAAINTDSSGELSLALASGASPSTPTVDLEDTTINLPALPAFNQWFAFV